MEQIKKLTKAMKSCIELEISNPGLTMNEIAERMGKHINTIYNWKHSQIYLDELDKRLLEVWADSRKMAQENMFKLANCNNPNVCFQANKYILDSAGYGAEQKISVNADVDLYNYKVDYGEDDSTE